MLRNSPNLNIVKKVDKLTEDRKKPAFKFVARMDEEFERMKELKFEKECDVERQIWTILLNGTPASLFGLHQQTRYFISPQQRQRYSNLVNRIGQFFSNYFTF